MDKFYVLDSSEYFVKKIFKKSSIQLIYLRHLEDVRGIDENIIFIANDTEDFMDYIILSESKRNFILIVTNPYLIGKLKKSSQIKFYEFLDFENNILEILQANLF